MSESWTWLDAIEKRWKAFKHWTEIRETKERNSTLYSDSAGPDVECLVRAVRMLRESLSITATPENQSHLVHPKCFCGPCKQKEILTQCGNME